MGIILVAVDKWWDRVIIGIKHECVCIVGVKLVIARRGETTLSGVWHQQYTHNHVWSLNHNMPLWNWRENTSYSITKLATYARCQSMPYVTEAGAWHNTLHASHQHHFSEIRWHFGVKINGIAFNEVHRFIVPRFHCGMITSIAFKHPDLGQLRQQITRIASLDGHCEVNCLSPWLPLKYKIGLIFWIHSRYIETDPAPNIWQTY